MREPAFTPGPWSLVINKFGENVLVQPATDRTLFLLDDGETTDWNQDEAEANAALIAAAPELLEALKHAVSIIEAHVDRNALGMNGDARDGKWPLLDEYLHHMKAAIAKASLEGGL